MCWTCYWGAPKPVGEIYIEALRRLKEIDSNFIPLVGGPAHIVWDDFNFDSAEWCLENFDKYRGDYNDEELAIVRWSLEELAKIPEGERDGTPDMVDWEHPELYPPTVEMIDILHIE